MAPYKTLITLKRILEKITIINVQTTLYANI